MRALRGSRVSLRVRAGCGSPPETRKEKRVLATGNRNDELLGPWMEAPEIKIPSQREGARGKPASLQVYDLH